VPASGHKAERAVDLETGAIIAVTVQGEDEGDTMTIVDTVTAAVEQVDRAQQILSRPQASDVAWCAFGTWPGSTGRDERRRRPRGRRS